LTSSRNCVRISIFNSCSSRGRRVAAALCQRSPISCCVPLTVPELVDVLGRVDLLLCNDSGPGHIAAACGRPVIPIFGPTNPRMVSAHGAISITSVIRDICPWRPCFDYCKFSEPYCLTKLLPERMLPEIREHLERLLERGLLPS